MFQKQSNWGTSGQFSLLSKPRREEILFENKRKTTKEDGRPGKPGQDPQRRTNLSWKAAPPPLLLMHSLTSRQELTPRDDPAPPNPQVKGSAGER